MISCQILTSEAQVTALADEWRSLQTRVAAAPFTGYDWAMMWWEIIAKPAGAGLLVAVCRENGKLVGVIPCAIRPKHGVRVLRLFGHEIYYYRNFLVEDSRFIAPLWQAVFAADGYDFADIKNIHSGTEEEKLFQKQATFLEMSRVFCWNVKEKAIPDLYKEHSRRFRRRHTGMQKKIEQDSDLEYGFYPRDPLPEDLIEFLVTRKKEWTLEKGKRGFFHEEHHRDFYEKAISFGAEKGILLFQWIKYQGRYIAALASFQEKNVLYAHTMTYDSFGAQFLPGVFLATEAAFWTAGQKLWELNFMEGEEEYKWRQSPEHRFIGHYAFSRTAKGFAFFTLYRLLLASRKVRAFFRSKEGMAPRENMSSD